MVKEDFFIKKNIKRHLIEQHKILNTNKYNTEKLESLITKLVDQWINYTNENINLFWD